MRYKIWEICVYFNRSALRIQLLKSMEKLENPTFGFDFTSYEETVKKINNFKSRKFSAIPFFSTKLFSSFLLRMEKIRKF